MAPLVRGKSVPLQICLYQYLFVLSLPIQISVLTQEKKSLPTKSDKSDGKTPLENQQRQQRQAIIPFH